MNKAASALVAVLITVTGVACTVPEEEEPTGKPDFMTITPDMGTEESHGSNPEPDMSSGQEQALNMAAQYLETQAFSLKGLVEQLRFEGFNPKQAVFAARNVGADWNEQAARAAGDYLSTMPFSKAGLIEQLQFDGYTAAQARYGANKVL